MRWTRGPRSTHLDDRRGARGWGGRLSLGAIVLALVGLLARQYLGIDLGLGGGGGSSTTGSATSPIDPAHDADRDLVDFISFVLDDVQASWQRAFAARDARYQPADLVLYSGSTPTACGHGVAATGPFYCPANRKVYIDLSFYRALRDRFGAPGDFAQAYVLAHELGHHVQNLLGLEARLRRAQRRARPRAEQLSVAFELQADCLAGVWGHSTRERKLLDPGDVEEGLRAAAAIGDDTLQKKAGRTVQPESFTHGSSAQRVFWLRRGLELGTIEACDTTAPPPGAP